MTKHIFLIVFGFGLFVQNPVAKAQGPVGLEIDPSELSKAMGVVLRRISDLNLETPGGGEYGFRAKGALVFIHETESLDEQETNTLNRYGRSSGPLVLPYEYSRAFAPDGQQRISFSGFAGRNMNDYAGDDYDFFSVVNSFDLLNFTWDKNYTYNNFRTFDFKIFSIEPRVGIVKGKNSYLAMRASTDIGFGTGHFTQPDGQEYVMSGRRLGYGEFPVAKPRNAAGFRFNYTAGLVYDLRSNKTGHLNVQANWKAGYHRAHFNDPNIVSQNLQQQSDYDTNIKQYDAARAQWDIDKALFDQERYHYYFDKGLNPDDYDDEDYKFATLKVAPEQPVQPKAQTYRSNLVSTPRTYGVVSGSLSYDRIINRKKTESAYQTDPSMKARSPVRLGFEIEWNVIVKDKFKDPPDGTKYDFNFTDNFNRQVVGRIVFKF